MPNFQDYFTAFELLAQPNELVTASQGNFSFKRHKDKFMITPTGVPWANNRGRNMFEVKRHPNLGWQAEKAASSEWRLHAHLYDILPAAAIMHTHPVFATVLSDSDVEVTVGEFPRDRLVRKTKSRFRTGSFHDLEFDVPFEDGDKLFPILLRRHGLVVASKSHNLPRLIHISEEIERLAKINYLRALLER